MKVLAFIKNNYKYFFVFLLIIFCSNFCYPLNLDEIWNYGFANNIFRGLIPYRDFNMVITPFYPFLMSLFLNIFGTNSFVMTVINAIMVTLCLKILFKLIGDKYIIVLMFMLVPACLIFPSYNVFLFILLVILIFLENKCIKNHYLIGFLLGILILTKQSVGFFLLLPSFYYIKDLKIIFKRFIGFIIPVIIFIIYLLINKAFYNFLDLCVFGLFNFTDNNLGFNFLLIPSIIMIILTIYFIIIDRKCIINYYVLAFYSIIIPIVDFAHFSYAFWAFLILILPKINIKYINYKFFSYFVIIIFSIIVLYENISCGFVYPNKINHFEYRLINNNNLSITYDINQFIGENMDKKVILFDGNGYYFRIINDEDCSYLDLLNIGNFGYNGSLKLIDEIKKHRDYIYLVSNLEIRDDTQTDQTALNYIIHNGDKIGSINMYDIYVFN